MKNSENSEEHWRNEEQDIMMSCSSDANLFFNQYPPNSDGTIYQR